MLRVQAVGADDLDMLHDCHGSECFLALDDWVMGSLVVLIYNVLCALWAVVCRSEIVSSAFETLTLA